MNDDLYPKHAPDYVLAHEYSSNHKKALERDMTCGCFHCLRIFSPKEIDLWIKDKKGTAVCPYCSVDSVIGQSSGSPITKEFLTEMKKYWFW